VTDRFYITIQDQSELGVEVHAQMQSEIETGSTPSLAELKRGQLIAVKLSNEQWYRALIEEINLRCCDLFVFLIDVGLRELTSVQNIRPLQDQFISFPAQAVCCVFSDPTARRHLSLGKRLDLTVDRIEQGQVGRIGDSELLLCVKMYISPTFFLKKNLSYVIHCAILNFLFLSRNDMSILENLGQNHANSFINPTLVSDRVISASAVLKSFI
jgi:hypothetical protein